MRKEIKDILQDDERRMKELFVQWNPLTGENSIGERKKITITDFQIPIMWLPVDMLEDDFVGALIKAKSIKAFLKSMNEDDTPENVSAVVDMFVRTRFLHDFPFWAYSTAKIKRKGGGADMAFKLNHPQRLLVEQLEDMRRNNLPIRLVLLKARQWGGSTCTQIYMAWLQLIHKTSLNSVIVAHVQAIAWTVQRMYKKLMESYPRQFLFAPCESYNPDEPNMKGTSVQTVSTVPSRGFTIRIGSAENPDGARGDDCNLAHLTEVAIWRDSDNKSPQDIVKSICGGIEPKPYTMIVYESTANGTDNFFHHEYVAAKEGASNFRALFIAWYQLEKDTLPFRSQKDKEQFAEELWENKDNSNVYDTRHEAGKYLWYLWEQGATLEGIHWYVVARSEHEGHAGMASEAPSDDIEAFQHSGQTVFDMYKVNKLRSGCKPPQFVGDIYGDNSYGAASLKNIRFIEDNKGLLWIWKKPEIYPDEKILNRYLVAVDIGGTSDNADYSVICVLDRFGMMDGDEPVVVAQWYGHIEHYLLAWKAAQIAKYYDNALLIIESNTLETKDKNRDVDGDQSGYILAEIKTEYDNLYMREASSDKAKEGITWTYGFHTNAKTKPELITNLKKCIYEQLYIERDSRVLKEYLQYIKKPNGSFEASSGHHDDLLMTRAIALWACYKYMDTPKVKPKAAPAKPIKKASLATLS